MNCFQYASLGLGGHSYFDNTLDRMTISFGVVELFPCLWFCQLLALPWSTINGAFVAQAIPTVARILFNLMCQNLHLLDSMTVQCKRYHTRNTALSLLYKPHRCNQCKRWLMPLASQPLLILCNVQA